MAQTESVAPFRQHEFSLGVGIGTVQEMLWLLEDMVTVIAGQKMEDASGTGAISLSYRYHPSKRFAFGVTGVFEKIEATYSSPDETRTSNTVAILGTARLNYFDGDTFSIYSGVGVGWCTVFDQSKLAGFQLTALGASLRFAGALGLFAELGLGYQGIIHVGLMARL